MMKSYQFSLVTALGLVFGASSAAQAQDLTSNLIECRDIGEAADRLACFDRLVGGLNQREIAEAVSASKDVESAGPPKVVLTAEESFGAEDLPLTEEEREREKIISLTASVVDIARNGYGKYVVILANGQVWRQLNADSAKLRVPKSGAEGMSVEIKRRSLGAHALYLAGENRGIRVERIK